jgi:hypothetical protein
LGAGGPRAVPIAMEITAARMQAVELGSFVRDRKFSVVCFADLPPSSSSKTRYLVRRLRSTLPELRIVVGRWAPPALADESSQTLLDAGADHVASLLIGVAITSSASWRGRVFQSGKARTLPTSRRHFLPWLVGHLEPTRLQCFQRSTLRR